MTHSAKRLLQIPAQVCALYNPTPFFHKKKQGQIRVIGGIISKCGWISRDSPSV